VSCGRVRIHTTQNYGYLRLHAVEGEVEATFV
jgi:hypothetical protein